MGGWKQALTINIIACIHLFRIHKFHIVFPSDSDAQDFEKCVFHTMVLPPFLPGRGIHNGEGRLESRGLPS